jgi:hypothetical protein
MVSRKSLRFGKELRAFKFYSFQFFQFYTFICFRDTIQYKQYNTNLNFFKWQQGLILEFLKRVFFSKFNHVSHVIIVYIRMVKKIFLILIQK